MDGGRRYDEASRDCDIVLKGGVTSGIVYPLAICELARAFRLRRVGGTSSGAIVGAFAVAAEYHRASGAAGVAAGPPLEGDALEPGFGGLEQLARQLAEPDRLRSVFLPDPELQPIFDVVFAGQAEQARGWEEDPALPELPPAGIAERLRRTAAPLTTPARLGAPHPGRRALGVLLGTVPTAYPLVGGALALGVALALLWPTFDDVARQVRAGDLAGRLVGDLRAAATVAVLVAAALVGAALAAGLALWRLVTRRWIPTFVRNGFGLTRGLGAATPTSDGDGPHALTVWMTRIVNELAGRDAMAAPLTFGDLWRLPPGPERPAARRLDFALVTTCLTLGRPLRLPDDLERDPPFYFDPEEWRLYFPDRVVEFCRERSEGTPRARDPARPGVGPCYYRLPPARDLPIVVATRLSVALPGIISATPLWSVDLNAPARGGPDALTLERCWCSDGGLASNFPVHFFDQLIPRWPTFAIDLRPAPAGYRMHPADETKNVWMPLTNDEGRSEWWTRLASDVHGVRPDTALRAVVGFVGAIVGTMQGWRDTTLARETGFRDRIAQVKLDPQREGGLNIAMPPSIVRRITARGAAAGALLRERYTISEADLDVENWASWYALADESRERWKLTTVSWDNHRWLRFRIAMAALQEALETLQAAYAQPPGYVPLVERLPGEPPREFRWSSAQRRARPEQATAALLDAIRAWQASDPAMRFTDGELPTSRPEVRLWPRM